MLLLSYAGCRMPDFGPIVLVEFSHVESARQTDRQTDRDGERGREIEREREKHVSMSVAWERAGLVHVRRGMNLL